jgi:hypothetical protein
MIGLVVIGSAKRKAKQGAQQGAKLEAEQGA